jgi:hypothetical protein
MKMGYQFFVAKFFRIGHHIKSIGESWKQNLGKKSVKISFKNLTTQLSSNLELDSTRFF